MWRTIQIFRVASSHGSQNESRTDSFETTGLGSKQHVFQVWTSCALQLLTGLVDYNSWLLFESLRVLRIIDNRCLTPREVVICYVISFCWWLRFYDMFSVSLSGPFFGTDCHKIKTQGKDKSGMYWLDSDGGSHSNAFQAYCDMMSYNGGWTMCYTTDEYVKPRTEVTYNASFPYGTVGYRSNCNNIPVSSQSPVVTCPNPFNYQG